MVILVEVSKEVIVGSGIWDFTVPSVVILGVDVSKEFVIAAVVVGHSVVVVCAVKTKRSTTNC